MGKVTETTLMYLKREDEVYLGEKQRKVVAGKLVGFGGKLEEGEIPRQAAERETIQESTVRPTIFQKMAEIVFHNDYDGDGAEELRDQLCHVYVATEWEGEPTETPEVKNGAWYKIDRLSDDQDELSEKIPEGDKYWLPKVLGGIAVKGPVVFDKKWHVISDPSDIKEVEAFDETD